MKKNILFLCLIFFVTLVFADTDSKQLVDKTEKELTTEQLARASLAMSSADYKVTAGDVYTLAFSVGSNAVSYPIIIDTSYKMKVANLSTIDVYNKTFMEVKNQVEQIISRNYPMSGIQFTLQKPAAFQVLVKGEVAKAIEVEAWALSRLSSLVNPFLTSYSSNRVVTITSANGTKKNYDLFLATRNGDLSQNPYVRPGDTITVNRSDRKVSISGAVERPGTYELLPGENLKELIEIYASGLTVFADSSRIELTRYEGSSNKEGDKLFLSEEELNSNFTLHSYDSIYIKKIQDLMPVMFIEGAVSIASDTDLPVAPEASNKLTIHFTIGENYGSLLRRYRSSFSAISDIENAYILRKGEVIPFDFSSILYDSNYYTEELVQKYDVLVVPFKQYFVTVAGAVLKPNRFPYIPDRNWEYYVALAGGVDKNKNTNDSVAITDITGKKIRKNDVITPETIIDVKTNSFLFYFNQYAPVVTTILSIITTSLMFFTLSN